MYELEEPANSPLQTLTDSLDNMGIAWESLPFNVFDLITVTKAVNQLISAKKIGTHFVPYEHVEISDFDQDATLEDIFYMLISKTSLSYALFCMIATFVLQDAAFREGGTFMGMLESHNSSTLMLGIWQNEPLNILTIDYPDDDENIQDAPQLIDVFGYYRLQRILFGAMQYDALHTWQNENYRGLTRIQSIPILDEDDSEDTQFSLQGYII